MILNTRKLQTDLDQLSIAKIGQWINDHDPRRKNNPLKTLKCKRSDAIIMATDTLNHVRSNKNSTQYRKPARRLKRYVYTP